MGKDKLPEPIIKYSNENSKLINDFETAYYLHQKNLKKNLIEKGIITVVKNDKANRL